MPAGGNDFLGDYAAEIIYDAGGSHRRIELRNIETGAPIIGGTYEPHRKQKEKYPLWLDLALGSIKRVVDVAAAH